MNKIAKIIPMQPLLCNVLLMTILSACTGAKTTADAPNTTNGSTDNNGQVSAAKDVKTTQDDAQSETRKKQLDADIRAREQRNNLGGDPQKRTEADLSSEVRSKLEANIPQGKLTVVAKNAEVTVSGVVKTQAELEKIKPLAMEIKGVGTVVVKAAVTP
jgi:hyperosmotically inducible periplasmic protein